MSRKKKSPQQLQEIATQFECFVAILCYNTGLKTTRWDVTYRKKNGSKRQVDVEYVRRNGIYRQKTVIECKYSSNPDAKIGVHHFMEGKDQKKDQKKKIKELVESMSGLDFSYVFSYQFHFEDLPMFSYQLHIKENNYQLLVYGKDEFNGFQCDFLLNENVFRLTMKTNDEFNEDEEDFKRLVGKEAFEISKKTRVKPLEVTKKTKKLHSAMISTNYLNEFSYNEQKKNPIRVI